MLQSGPASGEVCVLVGKDAVTVGSLLAKLPVKLLFIGAWHPFSIVLMDSGATNLDGTFLCIRFGVIDSFAMAQAG